jgi:thiol:disulfide interchange protein
MKKLVFSIVVCLFAFMVTAQDSTAKKVAAWSFDATKSGSGYTLFFKVSIAEGWKLFSTSMKDDEPNSRINFDSSTLATINVSGVKEQGVKEAKEPLLDNASIRYFENEAVFTVDVTEKQNIKKITGTIVFMVMKGTEFPGPEEVPFRFTVNASGELVAEKGGLQESATAAQLLKRNTINLDKPVEQYGGTGAENSQSKGLWNIFILGFLGGLVGLIMPCTFPMIPLTVSFFTKQSENKSRGIYNASMYGFFIFLIYVLLSLPFYFLGAGSSDILNNISTNSWLNIFFALVFVVFALSFFGLYEIALPSRFTNSVNSKSNAGSLGGIFFMALTLAIVSFSCTGPILGSLLVGALNQDGGTVQLTVAMAGFGLALGLPFALFALFPRWLHSLPRSGGWMDTVKIVFGFIELALAIKFISNADLVKHWGLLKREVFFGIWIVIGLVLVLYLFGFIRFKHEAPIKKLSPLRITFAVLFLAFTIYLIPGVTKTKYANLSVISGFPPPLSYSIYGPELAKLNGVEANVVNDYETALRLAKQQNKPILIDFTGWACVNCRKMEENVWTKKDVKALIEKDYILVSLYVDDRKMLPEDEQFLFTTADGSKKSIKTVGDKYITLQSENFRNASQPLYAIISPDEQLLNLPVGYTPDAGKYLSWLKNGIDAFKKVTSTR